MIKVGITGGIGAGKSTVCQLFNLIGIPIYDADSRAKYLMSYNPELKSSIKDLLGKDAYFGNGRLNRKLVANIVFNDKSILQELNQLVHPAVASDYQSWHLSQLDVPYTIKEAALLIESGSYKDLDMLILVIADQHTRINRVMKRDRSNKQQVQARIANQMLEEDKIDFADFIIDNSGEHSIIRQVVDIHLNLTSKT